MPVEKIHIEQFLLLAEKHLVFDVRSPGEYRHAHIPGAHNLPLFSDEERKVVGTTYKQLSRESAIKAGLDFFGPRMRKMVEEVETLTEERLMKGDRIYMNKGQHPSANVLVHCWRGGMRSTAIAWLLDLYGFKVYTLIGGYKTYRHFVLQTFTKSYRFKIVGGFTGSGKTMVLKELEKNGEKVIDLESIASHKGSAFGAIGQEPQPTQEMFENLLSHELQKKGDTESEKELPACIWLEDESQRIGSVNIQQAFWKSMRQSPVYFMNIPFEERVHYLIESYGNLEKEKMIHAILRIQKRLGGLETKTAIHFLSEDNLKECFSILLKYYDKYYLKGLHNRENTTALVHAIACEKIDAVVNAQKILVHQPSLTTLNLLTNE